jgi:hypothetical protein
MARVFISFVHEDERVANAVKRIIENKFGTSLKQGDVFLSSDRWTLQHGENWMDRIKRELKECGVVVSMLSKRSIERQWIHFEGGAAWVADRLLPVYFGNLTVDKLRRPYSDLIAVDLKKDPYGVLQGISKVLGPYMLCPPPLQHDGEDVVRPQGELDSFEDIP